jgi:hypothetical protein
MNNGTLRLALDHATKGRRYDTIESDKAVVSSHAARHVGGIVKPLKKTLIIEIKCLASGMGRNPRWEDHAELSPGLTVLVVGLYFFDLNAGLSQQERGRDTLLFVVFLVGLIRIASIGSPRSTTSPRSFCGG